MNEKIARIFIYFSILFSIIILIDYFLPVLKDRDAVRMKTYESSSIKGGRGFSLLVETDRHALYVEPELYNAMVYKDTVEINSSKIFGTILSINAQGKKHTAFLNVYSCFGLFPILLLITSVLSIPFLRAYEFNMIVGISYILLFLTTLFLIVCKIVDLAN